MKWATREHMHIDRAACAWLVTRFIDANAQFIFVADPTHVPKGATAFDMRGAEYSHVGSNCTFETILRRHELADPVLWKIAQIVHEADIEDGRFDAPEAPGLDAVLRGLSLTGTDEQTLAVSKPIFDGLYEFYRRSLLRGREAS
ncbi:chromate resistance protein ChrB domain-containing protein [Cryobacterium sp. Hh38]|uniref:chromate resistance protein ChrB domain-containing protein n=1 Tax=Cryobacterium sp. Hh38 TaxID=1259156 RepID=UPI001068ECE8|nr:chromate resistance protein ChrB domain-containing protein [Cryobacterium sp. Hh38]TFD64814.1 chromate resistance protein [Cryobacterium sp. Hh38]